MFKLKYAELYDNDIFRKYNVKPVVEDYYNVYENIFCVTDGVTRDNINGKNVPYPKNKEEVLEWVKYYPNPSGAFKVAKMCADRFIEYFKENKLTLSEKVIFQAVKEINEKIWLENKDRKINYLNEDLYGTEAVGGIIINDTLYCFAIGDCHIKIFDNNFQAIWETEDVSINFEKYENDFLKPLGFDWSNPKDRILIRAGIRNNSFISYNGENVGFSALTGEDNVMNFVKTYKVNLSNVKYICAYSDGCEPYFENQETIKEVLKNPKVISKEGKERTLVMFEKI